MNDDEKKPVSRDEADASADVKESDATKVTIKVDGVVLDDKEEASPVDDEPVVSGAEQDEDETSELSRELGRVEGIESGVIRAEEPATDEPDEAELEAHESLDADKPVDLDPVTPDTKQENALLVAMRNQEKKQGDRKSRIGLVAVVFGVLAAIFLAGAAYLYVQNADMSDKNVAIESDLAAAKSESVQLRLQQAKLKEAAAKEAQAAASQPVEEFRVIHELGARFKENDANKNLIYGYTVTSTDEAADTVAFSTITLARLAQRSGASAVYPCGFNANAPTVTRYTKDVAVGTSMASKVGKKIGEAYFVYTAPIAPCATTNAAEIAARDAAAKAVYESLEAVPAKAEVQKK